MFAFWGHAPHQTCGPFKPKPFAEICPLFPLQCSRAVCVDLPNPPPQTSPPSLPPLLPFLFHTPSAVLSSSLWARPKKPPEQLPSQELPSPKLIQTAGTLWPICGASILKRWREMEMVPPAIYSLPQFGLSDLLSTHPGNNDPCMLWPSDSEFSLNFWLEWHRCIAPDLNGDFPTFPRI